MDAQSCDIAVVGGGIAGAAVGLALAQAGFDVRLVERAALPPRHDPAGYDPRVYAISPGSAAFLDQLGVWADVCASRAAPMQRMQVWDRDPAQPLCFDAAQAGAAQLGWIVEHSLLADRLWAALPPGLAATGATLEGVQLDADAGVRLQLSGGATLHAQLAIGAEGAASTLREAAGIDTAGWSYASSAVVCHLQSALPHRGCALQRFLPSGPVALLPLADGRRSLVWSTTEADAAALRRLDDAAFARALQDAVQDAAGALSAPTPRLSFPLRLMHARRYVATRCALIGDSAHVVHPLAGQGLNLGLADAQALAATLAQARDAGRQWHAQRTLERYERARQTENLDMLAITDALGRAFAIDLPGWRRLLNLGMRGVERFAPLKHGLAGRATGPA